jgi:hypothetical protein
MRLVLVHDKRWRVAALAEPAAIPALDFLMEAPADFRGSAKGMWALFDRYAEGGRQKLTAELFHEASRNDEIWEFIKGRLRVYCFIDDGALVLLTHGAIKKTRKADGSEVARAVRLRNEYVAAKQSGDLQWETMKHD